ncbi:MAG TPA: hypothetical protein VF529_04030 [Solirubrobacteraceae bacterium]
MLSVADAAKLVDVDEAVIREWARRDAIAYVTPSRHAQPLLPRQSLLRALPRLYDLRAEFQAADRAVSSPPSRTPSRMDRGMTLATTVAKLPFRAAAKLPPLGIAEDRARALQHFYTNS